MNRSTDNNTRTSAKPGPVQGQQPPLPRKPPLPRPRATRVAKRRSYGWPPMTDSELLRRARAGADGELFRRLYSLGVWEGEYASQAAARSELLRLLTVWTSNRKQIQRLSQRSALGRSTLEQQRFAPPTGSQMALRAA